jgi:hypothetical protein
MLLIAHSRTRPAAASQPKLAAAPLVTPSSYQAAGSPKAIGIGGTAAGDDIFVLTVQSTGSAVTMTAPANFQTLREILVGTTTVKLFRWNGTGARPDNTTVNFVSSVTAHFMAQSWIVRGGRPAAGVHGAVDGASGKGPFSGPAGLSTAANSLVMHLWIDGTARAVLPPIAPTAGFGTAAGPYPADAGLASNTLRAPVHLHWGSHGAGPYVTPELAVSAFAAVGCITVETAL